MAAPLVSDDLWAVIAPLIPSERPKPKGGGRLPISHRAALTGILFVLKSGIPWEMLPAEMGCGSGMTCWRRLRDWQQAGIWAQLHHVLLDRLGRANAIDWSRTALDSASVPAKRGAKRPTRRGRAASTRRIGASRGQNATSSPTSAASPLPSRSARQTSTTANSLSA